MKQVPKPFSCCIIGETSLAQSCGKLLLERGHIIHGIITLNPALQQWAEEKGIDRCDTPEAMETFLRLKAFDYLFSIVNNTVLSNEVLKLPRRLAVNFHDALLPRYGGIHATSWAIMQHEPEHGITWHVMAPGIDTGAVLQQRALAVDTRETAASLNLKCYQAASEVFAELIDELAAGTAVETPQDLSRRTYMPRYRRPPAGCFIDWNSDARDIDALVRALDFGQADNPLGVAKTALGGTVLVVEKTQILQHGSGAAPGTVLGIAGDGMRVATATRDLCLQQLRYLGGSACTLSRLQESCRLAPGVRLWSPDAHIAHELTELYDRVCRNERFWLDRLKNSTPAILPDMRLAVPQRPRGVYTFTHRMPERLLSTVVRNPDEAWQTVCALFTAFLARHTGRAPFTVSLQARVLPRMSRECEDLVSQCVPLPCACDPERSLYHHLMATIAEIKRTLARAPWPLDMAARYASLAGGIPPMPIAVVRADETDAVAHDSDTDIMLIAARDGGEYRLTINTAVVDAEYACSIDQQFSAFVSAANESLDTVLERVPLVSPADEQQIIYGWNNTARDYNRGICMHQMFELQVQRQPDAVATAQNSTVRTYRELNRQANRIARHLITCGVKPGALVGVCLERSHDMIAGLLGILKAGAAYVPLEPAYPPERIAVILHTAGISMVLTQKSCEQLVANTGTTTVILGRDSSRIESEAAEPDVPCLSTPADVAYVIYTSGSTGTPKGVVVSHQAAVNLFEWAYGTYGFSAEDTVLFITSLSFDLSVFDIFGILGCGATIHIATDSQRKNIQYLARMLCEGDITFWDSAPSALQMVVPLLKAWPRPVSNTRFRQVFLSGDWIPVTMPDDIRQVFPSAAVTALGGATEATVWSNCFDVNVVEPFWRSIPYGRPIQNCRYYILSEHHAVCPPGVTGNLYIAGACLSKGYLNAPELTAQSYVPDPFHPGEVMYRTGDLARYYPDGTIEFVGRSDFQVKVRGYRIELNEIEHVLRRHPAVKEAITVVREDTTGIKKLVAYIVVDAAAMPSAGELREFAARFLAEYMVPNVFAQLEEVPVTANGKLDRSRLPWPITGRTAAPQQTSASTALPSQQTLTDMLARFFGEALGRDAIGPDEDIIDLGVTSLNLIQIAEKLSREHGISVGIEAFLDHTTVTALAAYLQTVPGACSCTTHNDTPSAPGIADLSIVPAVQPPPPALESCEGNADTPRPAAPVATSTEVLQRLQFALSVDTLLDPEALADVVTAVRTAFGRKAYGPPCSRPATDSGQSRTAAAVIPPAPLMEASAPAAGDNGSASLVEKIRACFQEEIGDVCIRPQENFIDLGVTSLNLIRIAEMMHDRLGLSIPVEMFLDHTTIQDLAVYLAGDRTVDTHPYAPPNGRQECPEQTAPPLLPAGADEIKRTVSLEGVTFTAEAYRSCRSRSSFGDGTISQRTLSMFLALLKNERIEDTDRYLYPSAGGLHAVQVYIYVKPNRIAGLDEGCYFYNPLRHVLQPVVLDAAPERESFHPYERPAWDRAAFMLLLVAQHAAIKPVYNGLSTGLTTLDAGYMGQLLMSRRKKYGLALRPVAGLDGERLHGLLRLDSTSRYVHALLGGPDESGVGESVCEPALCDRLLEEGTCLTAHFAGSAPDRSVLHALASPRLDGLGMLSDDEHTALHRRQLQIRRFDDSADEVTLSPVTFIHNEYLLRSTQRSFSKRKISFAELSRFMALLKPHDNSLSYLYPSVSGTYAVHACLYVKPDAVEGMQSGLYSYNHSTHALQCISEPTPEELGRAHLPGNRAYFNASSLSLYLMAKLDELQPAFGGEALYLAMLEAGYIGQLLMDRQAEFGLGICPIGVMRFEEIRPAFRPFGYCRLLHSFVGGAVERTVSLAGHECLPLV